MSLILDANVNRLKEVCHYYYMVMWIKLSRHVIILTWLCWFLQGGISLMLTHYAWSVDNFQSLSLPLSHPDSFSPVLPHLRLVQGHPHHLTKIASACALCFASNQFLSNSWFSVRGLLQPGPTVALQKPQRCLMVHIVGLLPWWCFEAIWKSSGELKLGKWHHDCISINHKM